jgi:hypothetical protein
MYSVKHVDRHCHVIVDVLASGVVDFGFDYQSDQTKDYKIGNCCFSPAKACSISEYE